MLEQGDDGGNAWFSDEGLSHVGGLFEELVVRYGSQPALVAPPESLSFEQLERITRFLGAALAAHYELGPGRRLAVLAPAPEQLICMLAAMRIGATVLPLRSDLASAQVLDELQTGEPSVLLTHRPVSGVLERLETPPDCIYVPTGKRFSGWLRSLGLRRNGVSGEIDIHQLIDLGRGLAFKNVEPARDSLVLLASGKYGQRLMLTQRSLMTAMAQVAAQPDTPPPRGPLLAAEPLDDAINLVWQVFLPWTMGQACVLVAGRSTARVLAMAKRWRCRTVYARESTVQAWHQQGMDKHLRKLDLDTWWDAPLLTTAPQRHSGFHQLPQRLRWLRAGSHWPVIALEQSQSSRGARRADLLPGVAVGVASDDRQADGAEGLLWVSGAQLMAGYWRQPELTAHRISVDGWLKTSLRARMNAQNSCLRMSVSDPAAALTLYLEADHDI